MIDPPVPWATMALPTAAASSAGARRLTAIVSSNFCGSMGYARVVDEDVQTAECFGGPPGQIHRRVGLSEIHGGGADPAAVLLCERGLCGTQLGAVAPAEHEAGACGGEGPGDVGADALGGSGDQGTLAV
jgi:hypothetical protein